MPRPHKPLSPFRYFSVSNPANPLARNAQGVITGSTVSSSEFTADADAKVKGIDIEASFQVTPRWSFNLGYTWSKARLSNASIPCNDSNFDGVSDGGVPDQTAFVNASDWNGMGAPISRMIWGDRKTEEVRWRGANGPDLAKNLSNTDVAIYTGDTGRPEGVYILQGSTAVHDRLTALGIRHRFVLQPGMTHSWPTWNQALGRWLPHLMSRFRAFNPDNLVLRAVKTLSDPGPAAHPVAFSYSTIEPAYSLHGWSVRMERAAVEFSALEVVGPRAFTLLGSGKAVVTTPAVGKPNAVMRVSIGNRRRPTTARTDAQGRLSLPLDLGPANRFQQYSPEADRAAPGPAPFLLVKDGSRFFQVRVTLAPMPGGR